MSRRPRPGPRGGEAPGAGGKPSRSVTSEGAHGSRRPARGRAATRHAPARGHAPRGARPARGTTAPSPRLSAPRPAGPPRTAASPGEERAAGRGGSLPPRAVPCPARALAVPALTCGTRRRTDWIPGSSGGLNQLPPSTAFAGGPLCSARGVSTVNYFFSSRNGRFSFRVFFFSFPFLPLQSCMQTRDD